MDFDIKDNTKRDICKEYRDKYNECFKLYGEKNNKCIYYYDMINFFNFHNTFFKYYKPFN